MAFIVLLMICFARIGFCADFNNGLNVNLQEFSYEGMKSGGSEGGGVHILANKEGRKVTIKCSPDKAHMKEEIIADALYNVLGVPVPKMMVLKELPDSPQFSSIKSKCPMGPYRVSEFVDGVVPRLEEGCLKLYFLPDAFLANRDARKPDNLILKDREYYHIDNGGSLRFRSIGGRKDAVDWSPLLIPERNTFLDHDGHNAYGSFSDRELIPYAERIYKKRGLLFETLYSLFNVLEVPLIDQQALDAFIRERLKVLDLFSHPEDTFLANEDESLISLMAGGAFIIDPETNSVLLGQRKSSQPTVDYTWCTLGGKADFGADQGLAHAVSREIFEESNGLINLSDRDLIKSPSHDLVRWDQRFRQYFVKHPLVQAEKLNHALKEAKSGTSAEYHQFKWVPIKDLLDPDTLASKGTKPYQPFLELLRLGQVKKILKNIASKKKFKGIHTQSTVYAIKEPEKIQLFDVNRTKEHITASAEKGLAQTVLHKAILTDELAKSPKVQEFSDSPEPTGHPYGINGPITEDNPFPYTPSEGYLRFYLEENYVPVKNLSSLEDTYRQNINRFFQKNPRAFQGVTMDEPFKERLVSILLEERKKGADVDVFYHGCDGNTGYLYDIFTELRQLLRGQFSKDTKILRALDEAFAGVETAGDFVARFTKDGFFSGNYSKDTSRGHHYADSGISANATLFGSPDTSGSCTLSYFFHSHSAQPIDVQRFIDYLNAFLPGLHIDKDRYWRLFEKVMGTKPDTDGRLLQMFIDHTKVDTLAYAAKPGGAPVYVMGEGDRTSHLSSYYERLKHTPELVSDMLTKEGGDKFSPNDLQVRIFLKPELTHDPKVMKTVTYHRGISITPEKVDRLKKELRFLLADDLSRWMQRKTKHSDDLFYKGSEGSKVHFDEQYKEVFGRTPTYHDQTLNDQLTRINSTKDRVLLVNLLKDHSLEELLVTPILDNDSYRTRETKTLLQNPWLWGDDSPIVPAELDQASISLLNRPKISLELKEPLIKLVLERTFGYAANRVVLSEGRLDKNAVMPKVLDCIVNQIIHFDKTTGQDPLIPSRYVGYVTPFLEGHEAYKKQIFHFLEPSFKFKIFASPEDIDFIYNIRFFVVQSLDVHYPYLQSIMQTLISGLSGVSFQAEKVIDSISVLYDHFRNDSSVKEEGLFKLYDEEILKALTEAISYDGFHDPLDIAIFVGKKFSTSFKEMKISPEFIPFKEKAISLLIEKAAYSLNGGEDIIDALFPLAEPDEFRMLFPKVLKSVSKGVRFKLIRHLSQKPLDDDMIYDLLNCSLDSDTQKRLLSDTSKALMERIKTPKASHLTNIQSKLEKFLLADDQSVLTDEDLANEIVRGHINPLYLTHNVISILTQTYIVRNSNWSEFLKFLESLPDQGRQIVWNEEIFKRNLRHKGINKTEDNIDMLNKIKVLPNSNNLGNVIVGFVDGVFSGYSLPTKLELLLSVVIDMPEAEPYLKKWVGAFMTNALRASKNIKESYDALKQFPKLNPIIDGVVMDLIVSGKRLEDSQIDSLFLLLNPEDKIKVFPKVLARLKQTTEYWNPIGRGKLIKTWVESSSLENFSNELLDLSLECDEKLYAFSDTSKELMKRIKTPKEGLLPDMQRRLEKVLLASLSMSSVEKINEIINEPSCVPYLTDNVVNKLVKLFIESKWYEPNKPLSWDSLLGFLGTFPRPIVWDENVLKTIKGFKENSKHPGKTERWREFFDKIKQFPNAEIFNEMDS